MAEIKAKKIKVEAKEYTQMKTDCDNLKKKMDEADSDVAYQGYQRAWSILTRYYDKATLEIRAAEKAESRRQSREKRAARSSKPNTKAS